MSAPKSEAAGAKRPYDPARLRHVHFIAIGGTGMGSLAGLVKARGIRVTGSDKKLYPPMSTALEDWGIVPIEGFAAETCCASGRISS